VITALVLMNVEPGRVRSLAEELLAIDGVTECYSVAGPYDLVAVVRVREHDQLSDLVTERIASHAGINATETLIAFRAFAKRDLGMVWDIGRRLMFDGFTLDRIDVPEATLRYATAGTDRRCSCCTAIRKRT